MKKTTVLFVMHERKMGGASKSGISLIERMGKYYNVIVLLKWNKGEVFEKLKENERVKILWAPFFWWKFNKNQTTLNQFKTRFLYNFNHICVFYILFKLRNESIDIVHTNSSVVDIGAIISKQKKAIHIWHLREFGESDQNLHFIKGNKKSYDFMNENTTMFICISEAIKTYYSEYLDKNKLRRIYNGVDISKNVLKKYSFLNGNVKFIICGALQEGKGHLDAIKSFKALIDKGYLNFSCTIIGKNINGYKQKLINIVSEQNLDQYINFMDYSQNIFDIRKYHDIELVCSNREAFGRVTIESMLCSNPVIASNTGANIEIIKKNFNGFLYDKNNLDSLTDILEKIVSFQIDIREIRKNAYFYAINNFSADANFQEINDLYIECLVASK